MGSNIYKRVKVWLCNLQRILFFGGDLLAFNSYELTND